MTKGDTVHLHVGDDVEAVGARFADAWRRAENGELRPDNAEIHLGFASWEDMVRVLSLSGWSCCGTCTGIPPRTCASSLLP